MLKKSVVTCVIVTGLTALGCATEGTDVDGTEVALSGPHLAPGVDALSPFLGIWRCEAEYSALPPIAAHTARGVCTYRVDLDGQWVHQACGEYSATNDQTPYKWHAFWGYDPVSTNYSVHAVGNLADTGTFSATEFATEGTDWTGTITVPGAVLPARVTQVFSPDERSFDSQAQVSVGPDIWLDFYTYHCDRL